MKMELTDWREISNDDDLWDLGSSFDDINQPPVATPTLTEMRRAAVEAGNIGEAKTLRSVDAELAYLRTALSECKRNMADEIDAKNNVIAFQRQLLEAQQRRLRVLASSAIRTFKQIMDDENRVLSGKFYEEHLYWDNRYDRFIERVIERLNGARNRTD